MSYRLCELVWCKIAISTCINLSNAWPKHGFKRGRDFQLRQIAKTNGRPTLVSALVCLPVFEHFFVKPQCEITTINQRLVGLGPVRHSIFFFATLLKVFGIFPLPLVKKCSIQLVSTKIVNLLFSKANENYKFKQNMVL